MHNTSFKTLGQSLCIFTLSTSVVLMAGCGVSRSGEHPLDWLARASENMFRTEQEGARSFDSAIAMTSHQEALPPPIEESLSLPAKDEATSPSMSIGDADTEPGLIHAAPRPFIDSDNHLANGATIEGASLRRKPRPATEIALQFRMENQQLQSELDHTREELRRLQDILTATDEELKSANEESMRLDGLLLSVNKQYAELQKEHESLKAHVKQVGEQRQQQIEQLTATVERFEELMQIASPDEPQEEDSKTNDDPPEIQ